MGEINIPKNDLVNLYQLMKKAYNNMQEACSIASEGFSLLSNEEIYKGNAEIMIDYAQKAFIGHYGKLSSYYLILYQYLLGVLVEYSETDDEIANFIVKEFQEMMG